METEPAQPLELADERQRIEAAQNGDLQALRPLFEHYADPLYRTLVARLGNRVTAEDVLRDSIRTALERIGQFRWQGKGMYGWLRQIAIHKAMDVHRHARRDRLLESRVAAETPGETAHEERADARLIAAEEEREARERVTATLALLNDRYRRAIELRLLEERPREACARELGVSVGAFDVLFHRAVRAFRKHYGRGP